MKKIMEVLKQRRLLMAMVCFISLAALSTAGCAGTTKTTTVTTQTTSGALVGNGTSSVTTHDETVTAAHPHGVIGGIFYTIGQVLIWPFKFIGSLFS